MDADFSHDPAVIPDLLGAAAEADVVVGSRYIPGGDVVGWSKRRHLLSRAGNVYARLVLGFAGKDATGGLRRYRPAGLGEVAPAPAARNPAAVQSRPTDPAPRLPCRSSHGSSD